METLSRSVLSQESLRLWKEKRACSTSRSPSRASSPPTKKPTASEFCPASAWEKPRGIIVQDLALGLGANRQRVELLDVALDGRHTWPGPVRAPQHFIRDILDARKILHQFLRRNARNIHIHILMPPHEKERFIHPQR